MKVLLVSDDVNVKPQRLQPGARRMESLAQALNLMRDEMVDALVLDFSINDLDTISAIRDISPMTALVSIGPGQPAWADGHLDTYQPCLDVMLENIVLRKTLRHADMQATVAADEVLARRILNDVAHELRSPLTAIQATAASLPIGLDEARAQRLRRSVRRLSATVDGFLGHVTEHLIMRPMTLSEVVRGLDAHAGIVVDPNANPDLEITVQPESFMRAMRWIGHLAAMANESITISWQANYTGRVSITIVGDAPILRDHPVMRVMIREHLTQSMGTAIEVGNQLDVEVPAHLAKTVRMAPTPMAASVMQ